jgi:hypothetical protein
MTSYALNLPERKATLLDRLRVRWASPDLDRRLAAGTDPDRDLLLRLRAARLLTPAARVSVAMGLEDAVTTVRKPKTPFSAAVPIRRGAVRGTHRELMALAGDLRHMPVVDPRGVAMASALVTDPFSPLYTATSSDELAAAVHAASSALRAR